MKLERFIPRLESLEAREVPDAKLQFINDSPYAAAKSVDVYVNGEIMLDDFAFQSATAFIDVPSQTNLVIDFTPGDATKDSPFFSTTLNLADGSSTVAVALGDPNATSGSTAYRLATTSARTTASNPSNAEFLPINGSPDLDSANISVHGIGIIAGNLAFGSVGSYQSVAPASYVVDVQPSSGGIALTSAKLDLTNAKGEAAVLLTSGFHDPASASDPALSLIAVFDDGTSETLAKEVDPAYAVGTVTAQGGVAMLVSSDGRTTLSVIAFPGATSAARVASADLNGDGVPDLIAASGPGTMGLVRIFDGATGTMIREIQPFDDFTGGINVAVGDITGDGVPDYVITPDEGGGPRVRVFNGATNAQIADFYGIDDPNFRGGVRAAIGDLNHDGRGDLVVAAGFGGGPRIAVYDGSQLSMTGGPTLCGDFFAFEQSLRNGAYVAVGDVNGDGYADLIVGGGPTGGPRVRVIDGKALTGATSQVTAIADFFAGDTTTRDGVRVAAKDLDGDGRADIITGSGPLNATVTQAFLATDLLGGNTVAAIATSSFDGATPLGEIYVG